MEALEKTLRIKAEILDFASSNIQGKSVDEKLSWWSKMTLDEEHMLDLTVERLRATLLMAIFVINEETNTLVAGAGIFIPRTYGDVPLYLKDKAIVEIGTNFVLPEYRRQGIGRKLIELRLNYARQKKWIPVSISSNKIVQNLFLTFNGTRMEDEKECDEIRQLLCLRCENGDDCHCCPKIPNCGWIFK